MDGVWVSTHLNVDWLRVASGCRAFHTGRPGDCIMIFSQGTAGVKQARGRWAAPAERAAAAAPADQRSETRAKTSCTQQCISIHSYSMLLLYHLLVADDLQIMQIQVESEILSSHIPTIYLDLNMSEIIAVAPMKTQRKIIVSL